MFALTDFGLRRPNPRLRPYRRSPMILRGLLSGIIRADYTITGHYLLLRARIKHSFLKDLKD